MVAVVQPRPQTVHRSHRLESAAGGYPSRCAVAAPRYGRRRAVAAGMVVALLVAAVLAVRGVAIAGESTRPERSPASTTSGAPAGEPFATYVVQPGDTVWSIATRMRPDRDPRPLVDRLVAEHGTTVLQVGEPIALPERR